MRWSILLALLLLLPTAVAQGPSTEEPERFLLNFVLEGPPEPIPTLAANEAAVVQLTLIDASTDDTTMVGAEGARFFPHITSLESRIIFGDEQGWNVNTLPEFRTFAGDVLEESFVVRPLVTVSEPYMELLITATMRDLRSGIEISQNLTIGFLTRGQDVFSATPRGSVNLAPDQSTTMRVAINHGGLLPRSFDATVIENPCGVELVPFPTTTAPSRGSYIVSFDVKAPQDKPLYLTEDCSFTLGVYATDDPDRVVRVPMGVVVNGPYMDPVWFFWALAAAVILFILIAAARHRKQIIEEEILGKPQKPWTIPVERVYLEHLEERDPRAAYVVRHFLMEEEYASSLLWYKHYKQATKGQRSKETLVVRQERKYERFQNQWQKRIAAPIKEADRFEAKLQKKLDRQAKAAVRKDRGNWKKLVSKIEKAHAAQDLKANAKWEKAAAKAEKKGQPVPLKPVMAAPDLPEEPQLQKINLADHKWNKKAIKFRKKMVKRQGDIEVKFEKKDARMLHKLRRKVHKIARKLDDPDFVEEHPLLAKGA